VYSSNFIYAIEHAERTLLMYGVDVNPGRWQGVPTEGRPDLVTKELLNLQLEVPVNRPFQHFDEKNTLGDRLIEEIKPNIPWAHKHFLERVSRVPSNPGEEYKNWPWWTGAGTQVDAALTATDTKFTHTYQERFWPKYDHRGMPREGIRYDYGDLDDVVKMLVADPHTRQATFPIFFPEDTGAVHGGRIPCTLHYHFMLRGDKDGVPHLHMWYAIRSCDLVRHFRDDLYMACRLMLWVIDECVDKEIESWDETGEAEPHVWSDAVPGTLHFTAYSFHVHKGDLHHVRP